MATYPYYWRPPTDEELVNDPNASPAMREAAYQRWLAAGPTQRRPDPTSQNALYAGAVAAGRIAPGMSLDRNVQLMQQFLTQGPQPMAFSSTPPNPTTDPQGYNAWYMQHGDVGMYNPTVAKGMDVAPPEASRPYPTARAQPGGMGGFGGFGGQRPPMQGYGGPMLGQTTPPTSGVGFGVPSQQSREMQSVVGGPTGRGPSPMYGGFGGPMPSYGGFSGGTPQRKTVMMGSNPPSQFAGFGGGPGGTRYLAGSGQFVNATGQIFNGPSQAWAAANPTPPQQNNPFEGYQYNPLQSFSNMGGFGQPMGGWSGGMGGMGGGNPFGGGFGGFGR